MSGRQRLAADLTTILEYAGPRPNVDFMAGLILECFAAGLYTDDPPRLAPPVAASGGNAETTEERAPQPPAEQPQRRLPLDDDS